TRIEPAAQQCGGEGGDQPEGVDDVAGQVRAGGVPAAGGQGDGDRVRGRGDRPDPGTDAPDLLLGSAVHGEDAVDVLQHAGIEQVQGPAGLDLLGRLEDEPHPGGQFATAGQFGQHQAGP